MATSALAELAQMRKRRPLCQTVSTQLKVMANGLHLLDDEGGGLIPFLVERHGLNAVSMPMEAIFMLRKTFL